MNQILATGPTKQRKQVNIHTIIMFFSISIIVFGVCLVTSGSYAVYKNNAIASKNTSKTTQNTVVTEPTVEPEPENAEIQINLATVGTQIQASVTGENEISFITYKFDNGEETREDIGGISGEITIDIPQGKHTLTVTAVDVNNNTQTEEKSVTGAVKGNGVPELEVVQDGSDFKVNVSDEIGLDKVEFILNGQGYLVRLEGAKEKEFRYPLEPGDNTLEVTAYNIDGTTGTFNAICHNN